MIPDRRARLAMHEGVVDDGERDNDQRRPRESILAARAVGDRRGRCLYGGAFEYGGHGPTMPNARRRHPLRPALLVGSCTQ